MDRIRRTNDGAFTAAGTALLIDSRLQVGDHANRILGAGVPAPETGHPLPAETTTGVKADRAWRRLFSSGEFQRQLRTSLARKILTG